ncbi:hypothetical protein AB0G32_19470 [Streptomyces sp. NPDC023723]|uniref:hypothetical protein n=1 Tax=Streptomyces sp. NPDC023723 TaxID=3154323 RepID=UPI0033F89BD4
MPPSKVRPRTLLATALATVFMTPLVGFSAASAVPDSADPCTDAVRSAAPHGRANFTCFKGIATVTAKEAGEKPKQSTTRRYVPDDVRPMTGYVDGEYRGRTEDTLRYGTTENGEVVFESSIFVRAIIGLGQYQYQWLNLFWSQNDGRLVTLSVKAEMKRYIRWPGTDEVVDSVPFTQSVYAKDYNSSNLLYTEHSDQQIFYYNLTNMVVKDLGRNDTFEIGQDIPGPYFQCYVTVPCKYPSGRPVEP